MKNNIERVKQVLIFGSIYLLIFSLLFIQFPLAKSLAGELDAVANLAMFEQIKLWIAGLFTGLQNGGINYPATHVWVAFGADFGSGIIYILFELLGLNAAITNILFIVTIFTLNSLTLFYFIRLYVNDIFSAFMGGLLFSLSQFMLANLEHPNVLSFYLCFTSLYLFRLYLCSYKLRDLILVSIVGGVQIYLSPYVFLFYVVMLMVLFLLTDRRKIITHYLITGFLGIIIISPYIYFFLLNDSVKDFFNPIVEFGLIHICSLHLDDLFRVLPNHLLFHQSEDFLYPMIAKIKSAYLGISFWVLAIMGAYLMGKKKNYVWVVMAIIGFLIALGPFVVIGSYKLFPSLLWPLYEYADFGSVLRFPARAFFITVFSFSILSAVAIEYIKLNYSRWKGLLLFLFSLFIVENIPVPMEKYNQQQLFHPDPVFINVLKSISEQKKVVLHLPSSLFGYEYDRREYTYMYWQSFHHQHILNGALGFYPHIRLRNDTLIRSWWEPGCLDKLIESNHIDFIIYHKDMVVQKLDTVDFLSYWQEYSCLHKVAESDRSVVFSIEK